jgi:hypothetical protein
MTDAQWAARRAERDDSRAATGARLAAWVGTLSPREVALIGTVAYWCEGAKAKPWRPHDCQVTFTNSDPALLAVFLAFAEQEGHPRERLSYRLSIHATADVAGTERWWAQSLGLPPERFQPASLKHHQPATTRRNTGADYRGCLVVKVPRGRELYWRMEGVMAGIAAGVSGLNGAPADRLG